MERERKVKEKEAPKREGSLIVKYRPRSFDEVLGQAGTVKALQQIIKRGTAQSFLFIGPSGCGKTTLAKITARALGVEGASLVEVDAATKTGVDNVRELQEPLQYRPFQGNARGIIIDECHMLSKGAWNALLKAVEEHTEAVFWFFCTTEPAKVPATIKTRCAAFNVKLVSDNALDELYDNVCDWEGIKLAGDIGDLIIREAHGSPRQLLMNLAVCEGARDKKEAAALLQTVAEQDKVIELCRFLIKGGSFQRAMSLVHSMGENANPESVRIIVCNYFASSLRSSTSDRDAVRLLAVLEAFSTPYNQSEKMAPLYLSLGRLLLQ